MATYIDNMKIDTPVVLYDLENVNKKYAQALTKIKELEEENLKLEEKITQLESKLEESKISESINNEKVLHKQTKKKRNLKKKKKKRKKKKMFQKLKRK